MPLSDENKALILHATNPIRLRWWIGSPQATEVNDLLNAARSEERAKAQQEGEGE